MLCSRNQGRRNYDRTEKKKKKSQPIHIPDASNTSELRQEEKMVLEWVGLVAAAFKFTCAGD